MGQSRLADEVFVILPIVQDEFRQVLALCLDLLIIFPNPCPLGLVRLVGSFAKSPDRVQLVSQGLIILDVCPKVFAIFRDGVIDGQVFDGNPSRRLDEITKIGKSEALKIVRKHRLWETFLVEKLNFSWD